MFLPFLLLLPLVSSAQIPFPPPARPLGPVAQSTTLVDALSGDSDYTSLLTLLQRARLIPTLNKLPAATLFAPTNDAIARHKLWQSALAQDNIHDQLRQELLYHLLNFTLSSLPADQDVVQLNTLHFPRKPLDPPSRDPPPQPPWIPVPGGTLGGEPQRLRVTSREGGTWVGVDAFGGAGAPVSKQRIDADNGVVLGIGQVLRVPPDLATVVAQQPSLSYLNHILKPDIIGMLNSTPEYTLFLPVDDAWKALPEIELRYLESEFASDDILRILNMHAVATAGVHWSDSFNPALNLTSVDGSTLEIVVKDGKTHVSSAALVQPDIYAANGVLHTVSSLLIPQGDLQLTPEKYLLTLNCTSFVSLLHSVELTSLINDTKSEYTILAPRDDVMKVFAGDGGGLPERGSEELKKLLSYHFIPGRWTPKKLKDGMLLQTALHEDGLGGDSQVLEVAVSDEDSKHKKDRSINFGGAGVIGDHIELTNNRTTIYFLSRPLLPPTDPLSTALPSLELSSFLAAVFSTSLADKLKTTACTTLLIPTNDAFKRLGLLVSAHLLAATSKPDLERVIQHHVLDTVAYSAALVNGSQQTYATLEGSDIHISRPANGSLTSLIPSGGWAGMRASAAPRNLLTQTGVVHELSDVLLPRSVALTPGKLVRAAQGTTMATLLAHAGMEWVLNGTAPPEGSPWADTGLERGGWTLLCPTDAAFKGYNLTRLLADADGLRDVLQQHLIPTSAPRADLLSALFSPSETDTDPDPTPPQTNRPLPFDDSATYSTLQSAASAYGDVVFRAAPPGPGDAAQFLVGIKDARGTAGEGSWARVLAWGRSTTGVGTGGVVQIDQLLVPYRPVWWVAYGAPLATGAAGVVLIGAFFLGVRALWRRDTTEATYEPVGGYGDEEDE